MDFEEFKRNFELFTKIDTPEKLAICERQYKNELLRTEDEKYFEPESIELGSGMAARRKSAKSYLQCYTTAQ